VQKYNEKHPQSGIPAQTLFMQIGNRKGLVVEEVEVVEEVVGEEEEEEVCG